ncbi:hypothetical protein EBZ39_14875 [bacterium]|nr:hypothetical protein [bacterium]
MTNSINTALKAKFHRSFRWTLGGSIAYESCKALHCALLLHCMPTTLYGAMGSIFSIIYLVTYIADLGATNSLPPFLHLLNKSRANFRTFLFRHSFLPHAPLIVACAGAATYLAATKFTDLPFPWLIPSLIFLETIRTFLRMLLHTTFLSKRVVLVELTIFVLYLAATWIPVLLQGGQVTLNNVFIPHFLDSIACVVAFIYLAHRYYRGLPSIALSLPTSLTKRLLSTKLFNYLLRVTRNMFTSNFLTPLFALRFGLAPAGTFYIASMMVNGLQAVVKSAIGYSGNALLANLKEESDQAKKHAFTAIVNKLMMIVAPVIIVIGFNVVSIIKISKVPTLTTEMVGLGLLCLFISFTEFFFLLYEQFYIIHEAANKLFLFKLFELVALYCFVQHQMTISPITTLAGLIVIRTLSFVAIATNAWYAWQISISLKTNRRILLGSLLAATAHYIIKTLHFGG